jgi:tetratricopeptide (TPR) repeat protein
MNWKQQLKILEKNKQWDTAIAFMQQVIHIDHNNIDAHIYFLFLLMNLLVEENYNESKHDHYEQLLKDMFKKSYKKFSNNAEFLFCAGIIANMSEWYLDITTKEYENMFKRALELDPKNCVYQQTYYVNLDKHNPKNKKNLSIFLTCFAKKLSTHKRHIITWIIWRIFTRLFKRLGATNAGNR